MHTLYDIMSDIINHITSLVKLTVYGPDGDSLLDVHGINVRNEGYWDFSRPKGELSQFKTH